MESTNQVKKPAGDSHFLFNCLAGILGLVWLLWLQQKTPDQPQLNGMSACLVIALIVIAHEVLVLKIYRNASTDLTWDGFNPNLGRVLWKLLGLATVLCLIASTYWLLPEYHGYFYIPFWDGLKKYGIPMLIAAPFYFWFVDGHMRNPQDGYWHLGRILLTKGSPESAKEIKNLLAGWAVKAFFLPLMTVYIGNEVNGVWGALNPMKAIVHNSGGIIPAVKSGQLSFFAFEVLFHFSYAVDLLFCVLGYVFTLKLLDSHIRSTEPTTFGWLIALICYQPFFSLIESQYLRYEDNISWQNAFAGTPLYNVFAVLILVLVTIYCLSTVAFGLRFSNLTYRGVITSGPYRFTKHPAYISKNLSWWLISLPFIAASPDMALSNCAHLLAINAIYFYRAKTEERHLSKDPAYVAYAQWINEHGIFARLGKLIPALRYSAPVKHA